ncbi:MAG: pyridoxamine 5'-phosphate oxidase family protein [Muricomes sp.]
MRRKDREMTGREEILHVLDTCKVIRIAMHDEDGIYILPLNYGYTYEGEEMVFYIHAALKGKKLDLLRANSKVGFEMDCGHELVEGDIACQYGFRYASIIGSGRAEIVEEPKEKVEALKILMRCQTGRDFEIDEKMASSVAIIKVVAEEYTGKQRK